MLQARLQKLTRIGGRAITHTLKLPSFKFLYSTELHFPSFQCRSFQNHARLKKPKDQKGLEPFLLLA